MKTVISNLKRASVEMILLSLLCEGDMYGYQMAQEIKKRSNGELTILEGSMYPILYRLNKNGDITYEEIKVGERLTRVYYHITDIGKQHLQDKLETFAHTVSIINNLTELKEGEKPDE